jgi:hypothetical protein
MARVSSHSPRRELNGLAYVNAVADFHAQEFHHAESVHLEKIGVPKV